MLFRSNFDMDKDVYYAELSLDNLIEVRRGEIKFEPIAKFPSVTRDFAFVCDEAVAVQDILDEFLTLGLCESAKLFDIYRGAQVGEGKKSVAISVVFRNKNKTLADNDIEKQVGRALKAVADKYGATLR